MSEKARFHEQNEALVRVTTLSPPCLQLTNLPIPTQPNKLNRYVIFALKALKSPIGIAAIVVLGGIFINAVAPLRPSTVQAIYGGAAQEDNSPFLADAQAAVYGSSGPTADSDIDYQAAEDLLYGAVSPESRSAQASASAASVNNYIIQSGDTLSSIAQKFDITITTLLNSNPNIKPTVLQVGQSLKILSINGVLHKVKSGDSLSGLAIKYGVSPEVIASANSLLADDVLKISQELIIPGGRPIIQASTPTYAASSFSSYLFRAGENSIYPLVSGGRISSQPHGPHGAFDIAAPVGTGVVAVTDGIVEYVGYGWQGGYGNNVRIRHNNGATTLYAHLSKAHVTSGQYVSRGEKIGEVGSTGQSTGPHLHLEVRK